MYFKLIMDGRTVKAGASGARGRE